MPDPCEHKNLKHCECCSGIHCRDCSKKWPEHTVSMPVVPWTIRPWWERHEPWPQITWGGTGDPPAPPHTTITSGGTTYQHQSEGS